MNKVVWGLVLLLIVLHQDVWFWTDERLVFGFLPIGLAWHMGISIGASITWFLATKYCWPADDDTQATAGGAA
ncbi:hypothetical protein Pla108_28610 [Botrimarina colliarenosi]|uniref:DUF3311 domain-containing protein n=1 Tax=Botrimarina colliarenosi TaxID=2528001 RepID=A0A5C6AAM3_9BACT|nr:DUF3311 domain-containing protein [Botrimarina colliarenosi]TWT97084.1 hypothetical protein Pla108_28610 [Botrimarina colliarenosi]